MNEHEGDSQNKQEGASPESWSRAQDYTQANLGNQTSYETNQGENDAATWQARQKAQQQASEPGQMPFVQTGTSNQPPFGQTENPSPAPNQPDKKKHDGCLIAIIVSLVITFLLGAATIGFFAFLSKQIDVHDAADMEAIASKVLPGITDTDDSYDSNNSSLRYLLGQGTDGDDFTKSELEDLQKEQFSRAQAKGGKTPQGIYFVGDEGDIKAGQYWIGGSDSQVCYYFVLDKSDAIRSNYSCLLSNEFYGHNIAEVSDGQVLVVINGEEGFCPLSKAKEKYSDPYTNGVFRVGTDIPAGTYFLKPGKDSDNKYAYYVMDDLSYKDDYLVEQNEETDASDFSGCQVTVKDGQYLELYNATATKGTQG